LVEIHCAFPLETFDIHEQHVPKHFRAGINANNYEEKYQVNQKI